MPDGEYAFIELFCEKPDCDCHRILIHVIFNCNFSNVVASINFGWKDEKFYKFLPGTSFLDPMPGPKKGPFLDEATPQSKYSEYLLTVFKGMLKDKNYEKRLERHYLLFKKSIKKKAKNK